ncbi:MAG: DUF5060 domain-containing protein [Candidatus Hydrogenedentes bacterium]|nr:DUF5060 domain-containing protein [Candidatus Hydrogenedentota bacterium]
MKRWRLTAALLAGLAFLAPAPATGEEHDEMAMAKPLRIVSVVPDATRVPVYQRITLAIDLEATYQNPFDSEQIRVDAAVTPPEGEPWTVPGFLYRPYTRALADGHETLTPAGPPAWQVRLSFATPGAYRVVVSATDATGTVSADPVLIEATPADVPGMVRRTPTDHRYFVTERGETFFLVGANVCWADATGTYSYDKWLPKYAENGCNYCRIWLSPHWFAMAMNTPESGFDGIDLGSAWRLDSVLELAERLGIGAMLCIDSFNILRAKERTYGLWEDTPYTKANGGPLDRPGDYFTNPAMLDAYRDRLRYLVARYGYSPSVFSWEFWNEVDIIDEYDSERVTAWHQDMARHLRAIDPWKHLIGTSHAGPSGDPRLDALPELEYVQTHHYGLKDIAAGLYEDARAKAAARDRPHFHGEYGISHGSRTAEIDPNGIYIHNGLYASAVQLQAGTPMTWWWDSYVEPRNLYPIYGAFARWLDGFDFVAERAEAAPVDIRYASSETWESSPADRLLTPEQGSWEPAPFNQPVTARISEDGTLDSDAPLARIMHGLRNHPDLHNPVTFDVHAPRDTTFTVVIRGVSGHGGARLAISVDGEVVRDEEFADPDAMEGTADLTQYNRDYHVRVPAGRHAVKVENTGADWFYIAYKIPWLRAKPPLRGWAVRGVDGGLIWIQNRHHTWYSIIVDEFQPAPVNGASLRLDSWPAGTWSVETWDTVQGQVTARDTCTVGAEGLEIELPPIAWDIAFRLRRIEHQ